MLKGCVMPVTDDKYTLLAKQNSELSSDVSFRSQFHMQACKCNDLLFTEFFLCVFLHQVKYKQKYQEAKGHYHAVHDTPQILHAKSVSGLVSEVQ